MSKAHVAVVPSVATHYIHNTPIYTLLLFSSCFTAFLFYNVKKLHLTHYTLGLCNFIDKYNYDYYENNNINKNTYCVWQHILAVQSGSFSNVHKANLVHVSAHTLIFFIAFIRKSQNLKLHFPVTSRCPYVRNPKMSIVVKNWYVRKME